MDLITLTLIVLFVLYVGGCIWLTFWHQAPFPLAPVLRFNLRMAHMGCGFCVYVLALNLWSLISPDEPLSSLQLKSIIYVLALAVVSLFFFVVNARRLKRELASCARKPCLLEA